MWREKKENKTWVAGDWLRQPLCPSSILSVLYPVAWNICQILELIKASQIFVKLTHPGANKKSGLQLPPFVSKFSKGKTNLPIPAVKPEFMCPKHSEVKQTKTREMEEEKGLLPGPSKENRQLMLIKPKVPRGFQGSFLFFFFFLFVVNFVIHWNKTAMGLHVFPIPIPPPTSLSTRSP